MPVYMSAGPRINFAWLLKKIELTSVELLKAKKHAASCRTRLKRSFGLNSFKVFGSHSRNDAIRHHFSKKGDRFIFLMLFRRATRRATKSRAHSSIHGKK